MYRHDPPYKTEDNKIFLISYEILSSFSGLQQKLLGLEDAEVVGVRFVHLWKTSYYIYVKIFTIDHSISTLVPSQYWCARICIIFTLTATTDWPTSFQFIFYAALPINLASNFGWNELQSPMEAQRSLLQKYILVFWLVWVFFLMF